MTLTVFLISGEPSGDRLGAALMVGLKSLCPDISFHGVGGPLMMAQGMDSLFPMEELSVMGLAEVLPKLRHLFALKRKAAVAAAELQPDVFITIDSPDFSLRAARQLRETAPNIPTIHYVAPTVWAWRPKRAIKMARSIDHVLALFPFEPPYMEAAGMSCDFVGHPVTEEPLANAEEARKFRHETGVKENAPLLLLLPGSRRSEISRVGSVFADTLGRLMRDHPDLQVVLPMVAHVAPALREMVADWPVQPILLDPNEEPAEEFAGRKRAAFAAADVALASSGTVSLELAAARTPMVVAYDMNRVSWHIIKRMVSIDTVTLVNLIAESRTIPEYLGPDCEAAKIAPAISALLSNPAARSAQMQAMELTMTRLGEAGDAPGLRAARSVLDHIGWSERPVTE